MPTYIYVCGACEAVTELERAIEARDESVTCPVCSAPARRKPVSPKLLLRSDPSENRPYWHNHDGYSHAHAPRRGQHRTSEVDH